MTEERRSGATAQRCNDTKAQRIPNRDIKPDDGSMAYRVGDPEGLTDREVMILHLKDKTGEKKVTLFNYACHPVTLGYGSNYIST